MQDSFMAECDAAKDGNNGRPEVESVNKDKEDTLGGKGIKSETVEEDKQGHDTQPANIIAAKSVHHAHHLQTCENESEFGNLAATGVKVRAYNPVEQVLCWPATALRLDLDGSPMIAVEHVIHWPGVSNAAFGEVSSPTPEQASLERESASTRRSGNPHPAAEKEQVLMREGMVWLQPGAPLNENEFFDIMDNRDSVTR
jgi:hypothetical protein